MSRRQKPSRAERRQARAELPSEGVYGVDATDAGADSWTGRYMLWALTADAAKARIVAAGFHKKQISHWWSPGQPPPEGVPASLGPGVQGWFRSRRDADGWTAWSELPADYRHPPQSLAAVDPTLR